MSETIALYRPLTAESEQDLRDAVSSVYELDPSDTNYLRVTIIGKREMEDGTLNNFFERLPDSVHEPLPVNVKGMSLFDFSRTFDLPRVVLQLNGRNSEVVRHEQLRARALANMSHIAVTRYPVIHIATSQKNATLDSLSKLTRALPQQVKLEPVIYR